MSCGEVKDWIGSWCELTITRMLGEGFVGPPTREQQDIINMLRESSRTEG